MKKKNLIFSLALVLTLSACGSGETDANSADNALTVATYGGVYGDTIREEIIKPFEEEYGVTIHEEIGPAGVNLGKIRQGSPQIDIAWLDGGVSEQAENLDVLMPIDIDKLENKKNILDEAIYINEEDEVFALSGGFYALGLVYNTEEISEAPDSWEDLWEAPDEARLALPAVANAMGVPFAAAIQQLYGGNEEDIDVAVSKLSELNVSSYYDTAGASENLFQGGQVNLGAGYATSAFELQDRGMPIEYVTPKEGALAGDIRLHISKNTSNEELAHKFIDFALSKEVQAKFSERLMTGPVNSEVDLDEATKERLPYGKEGSLSDLQIPDWFLINEHRTEWTSTINEGVIG